MQTETATATATGSYRIARILNGVFLRILRGARGNAFCLLGADSVVYIIYIIYDDRFVDLLFVFS